MSQTLVNIKKECFYQTFLYPNYVFFPRVGIYIFLFGYLNNLGMNMNKVGEINIKIGPPKNFVVSLI